ncbi:class I SAM-dependent DNA methyltransferase [Paenibacillus gansuensis]|uniref:Class I SAM-dependent DNA methyltransferase n=1 Tax=Paenibacillus gansuensis TaxID=306542 RepID=A0ABW5PLN6_9BACL
MELRDTFNQVAKEYDKFRPKYPSQLFTDILEYACIKQNDDILEIGCGTGQATQGFIELGYRNLTCIELGQNLAEFTREKFKDETSLRVIHSSFETWQNDKSHFKLAISGTAFHFIQPQEVGYRKVFDLLSSQGSIAFFWTIHVPSSDATFNLIRECYRVYAPQLDDSKNMTMAQVIDERSALTLQDGLFKDLEVKQYSWNDAYTSDEYISLLNTNSRHRVLPEDVRSDLFSGIKKIIDQNGGTVIKPQAVALFLARKND